MRNLFHTETRVTDFQKVLQQITAIFHPKPHLMIRQMTMWGVLLSLVEKEELRTTWLAPGHGAQPLVPASPLPPLSWASLRDGHTLSPGSLQGPGQCIVRTEMGREHWGVEPLSLGTGIKEKGKLHHTVRFTVLSVRRGHTQVKDIHIHTREDDCPPPSLSCRLWESKRHAHHRRHHRASYHHRSPHSAPPASLGLLVKRENTHADLSGKGLKRDRKTVTLVNFWPMSFNNARESYYFSNWKVVHVWLEALRYLIY